MTRALQAEGAVAWIFQAGPNRWRITDYLQDAQRDAELRETIWTISPPSYAELMEVDQPVFVWRAAGEHKPPLPPGIVAVARITGRPTIMPDDKPAYRVDPYDSQFAGDALRVPIHIEAFLLDRPLSQTALQHNNDLKPALSNLTIFNWARQSTTYPVYAEQLPFLQRACAARATKG